MKKLLVALVLSVFSISASAMPITVPTVLNPGDDYRLAFVTSTLGDATSTDIADYNAFVTGAASAVPELVALGTTWAVIGSTSTVDARDNTGTNPAVTGVPIYLLNDTKLVNNNAELWNLSPTLANPLNINEFGDEQFNFTLVWTGTNFRDGRGFGGGARPLGLGNFEDTVTYGRRFDTDFGWMTRGTRPATDNLRLYALSGILTAPAVPVPAAVWLFGSALGLLGWMRRKAA